MQSTSVLLIDDNSLQHELFSCYASTANMIDISHAFCLEDGLTKINEENPDVILLDNRLVPFQNFKETIPQIRASGYEGRIVVISSDVDGITKQEMTDYSVFSCIDKFEFDLTNFENKIGDLLAA